MALTSRIFRDILQNPNHLTFFTNNLNSGSVVICFSTNLATPENEHFPVTRIRTQHLDLVDLVLGGDRRVGASNELSGWVDAMLFGDHFPKLVNRKQVLNWF